MFPNLEKEKDQAKNVKREKGSGQEEDPGLYLCLWKKRAETQKSVS